MWFCLVDVGLWFFLLLLSAFWWRRLSCLCKLLDGRDWWWENLGLALVGRALLNKALTQLSGVVQSLPGIVFLPEVTQSSKVRLMASFRRIFIKGELCRQLLPFAPCPTLPLIVPVVSLCLPPPPKEILQQEILQH